jgi:hypothetical protein
MNVDAIYRELWRTAQVDANVHYREWGSGGVRRGASGHFTSNIEEDPPSRPEIAIGRDSYGTRSDPDLEGLEPTAVVAELITLAHEFGHVRSFIDDRSRWNLYDNARFLTIWIKRQSAGICGELLGGATEDERDQLIRRVLYQSLHDEARQRILDEEEYAWDVGRSILVRLGLEDFSQYDSRAEVSIDSYRFALGMKERWPDCVSDGVHVFVDDGRILQGKLTIVGEDVEIVRPSSGSKVAIPRINVEKIGIERD